MAAGSKPQLRKETSTQTGLTAPKAGVRPASRLCIGPRAALPSQFESKLYLPFGRLRGGRKPTGCQNRVAFTIEHLHFRRLIIGVVEEVKEFSSKLQPHAFTPKGPVFEKGKVKLLQAWTAQRVASQIPQCSEGWKREALPLDNTCGRVGHRLEIVRRLAGIDRVRRAAGRGIEIRPLSTGAAPDSAIP